MLDFDAEAPAIVPEDTMHTPLWAKHYERIGWFGEYDLRWTGGHLGHDARRPRWTVSEKLQTPYCGILDRGLLMVTKVIVKSS